MNFEISLLPYVLEDSAIHAASDRCGKIKKYLAETKKNSQTNIRFWERPPWIPDSEKDDRMVKGCEFPRLSITNDCFLLADRVTDAVLCIYNAYGDERDQFPMVISVEPLRRNVLCKEKFPWRVVIQTDYPQLLQKWLVCKEAKDWFGVGIDIRFSGLLPFIKNFLSPK